jgi:hypothetical protein
VFTAQGCHQKILYALHIIACLPVATIKYRLYELTLYDRRYLHPEHKVVPLTAAHQSCKWRGKWIGMYVQEGGQKKESREQKKLRKQYRTKGGVAWN